MLFDYYEPLEHFLIFHNFMNERMKIHHICDWWMQWSGSQLSRKFQQVKFRNFITLNIPINFIVSHIVQSSVINSDSIFFFYFFFWSKIHAMHTSGNDDCESKFTRCEQRTSKAIKSAYVRHIHSNKPNAIFRAATQVSCFSRWLITLFVCVLFLSLSFSFYCRQ